MPPSWLFVVVLAVALSSQETFSFVFGPLDEHAPSSTEKKPSAHAVVARLSEKTAIHFPDTQLRRPQRIRQRFPSSPDAISFPTSDVSDNKRFERRRRQLGFFDPNNQRRPNNPNRPQGNGGGGVLSFPTDSPSENNINAPRPNRPPIRGQQRPPWGQNQPPRPLANEFVFGGRPPMRTSRRPLVTPATTRRPVTVEQPLVTRPTPASTRAGCNCPSTPEFNPVCGGDRVTYSNAGKLKCANFCGNPVKMVHMGSCITTRAPASTTPASTTPPRVRPPPPPPPARPADVRKPPQWRWT